MCGIAGYINYGKRSDLDLRAASRSMLLSIETRGYDATGYAYIKNGSTYLYKRAVEAGRFVKSEKNLLLKYGAKAAMPDTLLLHTRHATQGSPKKSQNNHPIFSKKSGMTLIHNGWLLNEREVLTAHKIVKDGDVDSETVLRMIEKYERNGITRGVGKAMRKLRGAFACGLISEKFPNTLWLWRRGNPLWLAISGGVVLFASTVEAVSRGVLNAGLMLKEVKIVEVGERQLIRLSDRKFVNVKLPKGPKAPVVAAKNGGDWYDLLLADKWEDETARR